MQDGLLIHHWEAHLLVDGQCWIDRRASECLSWVLVKRRVDYRSANKGKKPEHPTLTAGGAEGPF